MFKVKKIFITGATGFIGYNLAKSMIKKGYQVKALVRSPDKADKLKELKIEIVKGDLSDKGLLTNAISDAEAVFHLAGTLGGFGIPNEVYFKTHVLGTRNILDVCWNLPNLKQFIFCSTIGVLGPCKDRPFSEKQVYNPTNVYERTKTEAEKLVVDAVKQGLPTTVVRPGLVYGPYDLHVLQMFKAIRNKRFFLIGKGKNTIHPVYIEDLIQGFLLTLNNPKAIGQIYNIAGEKTVESRHFFQVIADNIGAKLPKYRIPIWVAGLVLYPLIFSAKIFRFQPILTKSRLRFFINNRGCSIDKAKRKLGYQPKFSLEQGIKLTAQFYKEKDYLNG